MPTAKEAKETPKPNQPRPNIIRAEVNPAPESTTHSRENRIRALAYQLYENGGLRDGRAEEDWLNAEEAILKGIE